MVEVNNTPVSLPPSVDMGGMCEIAWSGLSTGDTGQRTSLARLADRTIEVGGTFGGATVVIQGSLRTDPQESEWLTLVDSGGIPLSFTSAGIQSVMQQTLYIRPKVVGGTGTSIDVFLLGRRY